MSEDIHSLLGKYFSGQLTTEETAAVLEWKNASEENASEFHLLEKIWQGFDETPPINFDTTNAWRRVDSVLQAAKPRQAKLITLPRLVASVAALFVIVLGIWWLTGNLSSEMQTVTADAAMEVRLDDGSVVSLRKGATLRYPSKFRGDRREVSLDGEGFFEVAHNPRHPFVIAAGDAEVTVLGTSFSLNTRGQGVELVVKTGKVRFALAKDVNNNLVVTAGEKATLSAGTFKKETNTDPNFDAWQTKKLVFNDTPLKTVAATLSDYFGVNISIAPADSAQIAENAVTHEFRDPSLESALQELELITTYQVKKIEDSNYEISIK